MPRLIIAGVPNQPIQKQCPHCTIGRWLDWAQRDGMVVTMQLVKDGAGLNFWLHDRLPADVSFEGADVEAVYLGWFAELPSRCTCG